MTTARITIEPMHAKYNAQVGQLFVYGFREKFQHLTNMRDDELALFFEKLLDHFPADLANPRMVALLEGEVIGSLSIKWQVKSKMNHEKKNHLVWKSVYSFGLWNSIKMALGLSLLHHTPQAGECYIADVVVHPDHRSKGVGKRLFEWAQQMVQNEPSLDRLSLHVSGQNLRAKQLYENLSFTTHSQKNSMLRHVLFRVMKWCFMVQQIK